MAFRCTTCSIFAVLAALAFAPSGVTAVDDSASIRGLTGTISKVRVAVPASAEIKALADEAPSEDLDMRRMAQWAMNYLARTPRPQLNDEPVFQCHPLRCPPVPAGSDPVVSCDTDARMDWEWYFMRDITGSASYQEEEARFHRRIRSYIAPDGRVWSMPSAFVESATDAKYTDKDRIVHVWGATKILESLSLDFAQTKNSESKLLARKVMLALKRLATWDEKGHCWFACGMGGFRSDGSVLPNSWNVQPAPIVEPLVTYWQSTGDSEGLDFAKAYARGIIDGSQPDGIRFDRDGHFNGHSHATMHALWGVAHLGLLTDQPEYVDFVRRAWEFMLTRGTGAGWFPAGPDNCNETCCVSDMISIAAILGRSGHTEYFDYVDRFFRNYINNLQFVVTPEFEAYYRKLNASAGTVALDAGLAELRKFQGGIIGGSGVNDYENVLLGRTSGFEMFGCCAPEGMRAIHTAWTNTIDRLPESALGPKGVYVNLCLSRGSPWGEVRSFMPSSGRLTVKASVKDSFFLRPPHWASHEDVHAFVNSTPKPAVWSGHYVRFDVGPGDEISITYPLLEFTQRVSGLWKSCAPNLVMTYMWRGNMVVASDPAATETALFLGRPRQLPPPTEEKPVPTR